MKVNLNQLRREGIRYVRLPLYDNVNQTLFILLHFNAIHFFFSFSGYLFYSKKCRSSISHIIICYIHSLACPTSTVIILMIYLMMNIPLSTVQFLIHNFRKKKNLIMYINFLFFCVEQ